LWDKTIVLPGKPISISLKPTESEILAPPYKPFLPDLAYAKAAPKPEPEKKKEAPPLTGTKGAEKVEPTLPEAADKKASEMKKDTPEPKENAPDAKTDAPDAKKDTPETKKDAPETKKDTPETKKDAPDAKTDAPETKKDTDAKPPQQ